MPRIYSIGKIAIQEEKIVVTVDNEYRKALTQIEAFSHIHLLCVTKGAELTLISGKIISVKVRQGILILEKAAYPLRVEACDFPLNLIDMKPYMPSEDNAPAKENGSENFKIAGKECDKDSSYDMTYAGEIRNTHGVTYLQYNKESDMPKRFSEFERVVWWFHKFEDKKYRRILQCEPLYECDGKVGVFACRAPVRPNPIAMTVVKIVKVDYEKNRVYINGIESYDHTPFLGLLSYHAKLDQFKKGDVKLPPWAENWPDEVDLCNKEEMAKNVDEYVNIIDSKCPDDLDEEGIKEQEILFPNQYNKPTHLLVKGARENNLKGISVAIPYGKITAVVGVSGSGKSSLVMDTIYAECRRRMEYLTSESAYRISPQMDSMSGCMPTVLISQKEIRANSNTTIGTFSGINKHLRCIYAAIGKRQFHNPNQVVFKLTPATFSFLDPECRCPACNGSGKQYKADIDKIIAFPEKSLLEGASPFLGKLKTYIENPNANWMKGQVVALAKERNIDLSAAWENLPQEFREIVLNGDASITVSFSYDNKKRGRKGDITRTVEGIIPTINRLYIEDNKGGMAEKYMIMKECDICHGERLGADGRLVTVLGVRYPVAAKMTFSQMHAFALKMKKELPVEEEALIHEHIASIISLCNTAKRLGISYLELNREVSMISGGESQRLKLLLAFQNHMTGILYLFDEPSKRLSAHEYSYIIAMMKELVAEGNTILMVEHNMDMIQNADYVIEIGPKAGALGGYLMAEGQLQDVIFQKNNTMLGKYAKACDRYDRSERPIRGLFEAGKDIAVVNHVTANNLQDVSVVFPKKALTCITGVSGSGKSTLLYHGILPQMKKEKTFKQVILVESKIIGASSRSIVATYIGIMDEIRTLYASTDVAKEAGYIEKDFSFNTGKLRCDSCKGDGRIKIPFTEDSYAVCPVCHGKRYAKAANEIVWSGKTIAETLELSVEEAIEFFKESDTSIGEKCKLLEKVGLSYIKLGQSTGILSGGEAARLKIASCLVDAKMNNVLFLLDEPTCGLHFSDIDNLISLLYEIIDMGNTVVAIEHNKRFLSAADYLITMGPGAGSKGGNVISGERKKSKGAKAQESL